MQNSSPGARGIGPVLNLSKREGEPPPRHPDRSVSGAEGSGTSTSPTAAGDSHSRLAYWPIDRDKHVRDPSGKVGMTVLLLELSIP